MKRKIAVWSVIILANVAVGVVSIRTYNNLLGILGFDGQYDFNNNLIDKRDLNKFFEYDVYAKTSINLETPENIKELLPNAPKNTTKNAEAPAVIIGRYVLMASHTNDSESFTQQKAKIQSFFEIMEISFEFKVLEYKVALLMLDGSEVAIKELYRNKEKDFALFELPQNVKILNFPFEIGNSDELLIGHFLYINGRPEGINYEIARPGYVTSLALLLRDNGINRDDSQFSISQSTDQGDSGSPIVAFRDGKPELVGIYLGWVGGDNDNSRNTRSRALKINTAIDEINERLGINLRELQRNILNKK